MSLDEHVDDKRLVGKAELRISSGSHHQQSLRTFTVPHSRGSLLSGLVQTQLSTLSLPLS